MQSEYFYDLTRILGICKRDNTKGQVYRVSDPYFAGGTITWAETYAVYDDFGRVTTINRNTGKNTTFSYSTNRVTETTTGKTNSTWKEYDSQGLVTKAHDSGGDITYVYYPDGKVKSITAPGNAITSMEYNDAARNQTKITDPSAGAISYSYDSFGRIKTQTDARGKLTRYNYYPDGRINTRITPEGTTTYSYNTSKQLTGISSPSSVSRTYGYDTQGRVNNIKETIFGNVFSTTFTFDALGRLATKTHPSNIVETLGYNSYGYLSTISAGGSVRYTITGRNAREQLTAATYGSNLTATYGYDAYGYPSSTTTGTVQNYSYVFNPVTGNLSSRKNELRNLSENFAYDTDGKDLDRLTSVTGPQNLAMTYADNGNISTKSDIDATTGFSYGLNAGPYALTGVTSSTNVIPAFSQTVTYNSFKKVTSISEVNGSQTINTSFTYNSDNQRASMTVGVYYGSEILTRYYVGGSYMKEVQPGTTNEYTYLGGDAYTAPVVVHNARGVVSYYYLLRDYLGNITHQVNTSNAVVAEFCFDAWGRRRNATNWTYTLDANDKALFADRGFTGHEYLPWYKLYNMNGRMYDPAVGRFLSADPLVQDPGNSQSYNRYSYCLNNPLKYADPSGYKWMKKTCLADFNERDADGLRRNSWGGGGAPPSNTPHIDRQLQECMKQDASSGWRTDSETGEPYNVFTYENGWDALGEHVNLPKNIDQSSLFFGSKKGVRGVWFQSSDLVGNSKGWRDGINDPNSQFVVKNTFVAFDASGNASTDGGMSGIPENNFIKYSLDGISVWAGTIQTSFDAAKVLQPTVSTWIKGAKFFGKTSNYLGGVSIFYDFATGTANSSTIADGIVMVGGAATIFFGGVTLAPWVAGAGVVYGTVSVCGGEAWLNRNIDLSKYMNFVKPSNHY